MNITFTDMLGPATAEVVLVSVIRVTTLRVKGNTDMEVGGMGEGA